METTIPPVGKAAKWTGLAFTILPSLMLFFSAAMKFTTVPDVVKGFEHLGWSMELAHKLGVIQIACTLLYLIPQTSVLGAILLTGYLGGATATTMRVGDDSFMQPLLGVLIWGGLFLRDPRIRALIPLKR